MTITIAVTGHGVHDCLVVSDQAKEAVRIGFNPSAIPDVDRIKALTGGLLTLLYQLQAAKPEAGREFAKAITEVQDASMWAVLAAMKGVGVAQAAQGDGK